MSAYYDLYQSPPDENGESVCLHARILPRGTISAGKFRELVAKATGFSPAILDGTLQAVTDELYSWLSEGWTVEVAFYAPCPPLVLDTKTVDDPGNYGFSLVGAEGEDIAIKSVRLVGKNAVQLLTEKDPGKGRLRYGMTINEHRPSGPRTGARGCLRDSQGDEVKAHIQGKDYRMDNWCPFFDYSLSKGH